MPLTYTSYLRLDELLALQRPRSEGPEHDEMLFIVIHQAFELWFKQVLHELDRLSQLLFDDRTHVACRCLGRVLTIWKVLVRQMDILETLSALEFLSFRDRLQTASGFQSVQFRELEFLLGFKRRGLLETFPPKSPQRAALERRLTEPSIWDRLLGLLHHHGYEVPAELRRRDVTLPVQPSDALQQTLLHIYRGDPVLSQLCDLLLDLDEGVQEWRYRHVKVVERTLGNKPGTGGSSGAEHLRRSLFAPLFPDLWAVRSLFSEQP